MGFLLWSYFEMGFKLKTYMAWLFYFLDCRFENRQRHQSLLRECDRNILDRLEPVSVSLFRSFCDFRLIDPVVLPGFPMTQIKMDLW